MAMLLRHGSNRCQRHPSIPCTSDVGAKVAIRALVETLVGWNKRQGWTVRHSYACILRQSS